MTHTPSDIDLVKAMQHNDTDALTTLYNKYFDKLYKYFYFRVYDRMTAEDLNSTTRMHIIEKINTFDTKTYDNVSSWIYRIAHHTLIDYRRSHQSTHSLEEDRDTVSYHPDMLQNTENNMTVQKLLKELETMHPHAKDIILMKVWEGMSHTEIAEQLDISVANSKKIYSRSMQELQKKYSTLLPLLLFIIWSSCKILMTH